jgi:hypothetical protein
MHLGVGETWFDRQNVTIQPFRFLQLSGHLADQSLSQYILEVRRYTRRLRPPDRRPDFSSCARPND